MICINFVLYIIAYNIKVYVFVFVMKTFQLLFAKETENGPMYLHFAYISVRQPQQSKKYLPKNQRSEKY